MRRPRSPCCARSTAGERAPNRLIEHLAGSEVLDDVARDQLSDWFLGDALAVSAPRRWFPGPFLVELSRTADPPAATTLLTVDDRSRAAERARVTARRSIWPPLRRWAACHAVERSPARWAAVLTRAGVLATQDGTAMAAGVMDAAAAMLRLPPTPADGRDRNDSDVEVGPSISRASERTDSPTLFDI